MYFLYMIKNADSIELRISEKKLHLDDSTELIECSSSASKLEDKRKSMLLKMASLARKEQYLYA